MEEIFLNLVNLSLTASWLILAVALLRLLIKKAPKWITCAMWLMVGLRLLLPFSLESAFSLIPSTQPLNPGIILESNKLNINTAIPAVDAPVNAHLGDTYYEGVTVPANYSLNITTVLTAVWIIGIIALLTYSVISFLRLRLRMRTATVLRGNIRESDFVESPFVLGLFKPTIYLPYNMNESDAVNVIAHENAHIKRLDHIFKPLMFLICSVYWFNPLVWLAYALLCRDIELACDEHVIKSLSKDERKAYSSALLACSAERRRVAPCPLAFGETDVKRRIKTVLNYKKPAFWIALAAVICAVVCCICFMTDPKTDKPVIDLSDIEQMNIGAEMPRFKYGDKSTAIFEGGCGVVVYDLEQSKLVDRIPYDKIVNLADFKMPVTAVSVDGKTLYIGEAQPDAIAPFGKYIYKYDFTTMSFSKTEPIDRDDVKAFASSELAAGYNKEYDKYLDLSYVISYEKVDLGDSFMYLRANSDWSMKSLQLVVCNLKSGLSKAYDVWSNSEAVDIPVSNADESAKAESRLDDLHEKLKLPKLTAGRYTYEKENIIDSAYLEIEENQTFIFNYSVLSSYIARGKYTVEGNEIHCKTDDGLYEYVFTVKDGTLVFNKQKSSKLPEYSKVSDNTVFM